MLILQKKFIWQASLSGVLLGLCGFFAAPIVAAADVAEDAEKLIVVKIYSGLEFKGELKQTTEDNYLLHTPYGDRTLRRSDVVSTRMQLTPEERESLKSLLVFAEKAAITAAAEADAAARVGMTVSEMKDRTRQIKEIESNPINSAGNRTSARSNTQTSEEKIYRGLSQKVTLEFVDTPLSEAVELLQSLTHLNIILAPKVRDAKPVITLRVKDMETSSVLKWMTQLTETHAELKDQAIWITDQPSKEVANKEKEEIIMLAASMHTTVDLPPEGVELTDTDRTKIALQLWEKEQPVITDFPGPEMGLDGKREGGKSFAGK